MKKITITKDKTTKELGDLFGLFFEDINHAADGGLYAELVRNRSFEFDPIDRPEYTPLTAWEKSEKLEAYAESKTPLNENNKHYLRVVANKGDYIENLGFNTGIYTENGKNYDFSLYAIGCGELEISVCEGENAVTESVYINLSSKDWTRYEASIKSLKTTYSGHLRITFKTEGEYLIDMVSLFPEDTFNGKKYGLRRDIAEALKEMHPKFMRFPGGCLTHDGSLDINARNSMYRWIKTIGPVEERPSWRNNWGYNQSLGLGYYEYFCFCEEIGAKPLPVVPGGFNPHKGEGVPIEEIDEWVNETLMLIEFANGDESTKMGAVRAHMGHPLPFNLEYLGVGNEEIGDGFFERYPYFHNAIREKYPDIKIINTAGPFAVGEGNEAGWKSALKYGSDLVDEHYYSSPEWFLANNHHYDDYDVNGPKVFLGEYASWGNTFYNALVEAAYMTHLEKAGAVSLACYAPMLCNVDYRNWTPDMLFFNNHELVKTPNYYVQRLFMLYQGESELYTKSEGLDEIISLSDGNMISGALKITGNDISGKIYDMKLTKQNGETVSLPDLDITCENKTFTCMESLSEENFIWEFSFKRSEGRKGLKIDFGCKENENTHIMWEFGGWDNWDCNLSSFVRGRASTISHRIFHVTDEEYRLKLEVEGRHIKTYVNGVLMNDTVDRQAELEELYTAISKDASGNIYIKAVNLTGEDKTVTLLIPGSDLLTYTGEELTGELSGENTFENKNNIVPEKLSGSIKDDSLEYCFKAHSVTALKLS